MIQPSKQGQLEVDDEVLIFATIEEAVRTGNYIDPQMRGKIVDKPIAYYNPLSKLKASMGVDVRENEELTQAGGDYRPPGGRGMTRAEFERLRALG
jgi:hypothetical protein